MILDIVYLVLGLGLILLGANALVDGASAIAKRMGLSDLVIGLTVVAFGTSAPELVISVTSAANGAAGLAIGNAVGSNIFNILVIIGLTALIHPIAVERTVLSREVPMVLISSLVILVMGNSVLLNGASAAVLQRTDGIVLMIFFAIFMWYLMGSAKREKPSDSPADEKKARPLWLSIVMTVGGLGMLIYGGDRFVAGASGISKMLGVSDAVIGLTVAAVGTSLPELATSIVGALKGQTGLAIGNVIGSCIFNIFMVLGLAATVAPLPFGTIGNLDLLVLMGASVLFWMFGWLFGSRTFTRIEGALLLIVYIGYMYLVIA